MAKEAAQSQDQSMEEILQSIKRIIAEENTEDQNAAAPAADEPQEEEVEMTPEPAPAQENGATDDGDVLELTDIAETEEPAEEPEAIAGEGAEPAPLPEAATQNGASALDPDTVTAAAPEPDVPDSILEAVDRPESKEEPKDVLSDIDSLLSSEAAKASAKALKSIPSAPESAPAPTPSSPGMSFRSGTTVEDLAMEALRPMLKEWLDSNLPAIVEQLVEREIKKISKM